MLLYFYVTGTAGRGKSYFLRNLIIQDNKASRHYPGWSLEVLKYLYEEREITASGHEPTDADPGIATSQGDYSLETYILSTNHTRSSC